MPWTILDYKGDRLINRIVHEHQLKEIRPDQKPPTKPGLYRMLLRPKYDDEAIEIWLQQVWKQQNHGLYIDEGYALPQRGAFDTILTQGRARHIPVIALYQRPVWMSRFAVAQADHFAVFEQNDDRDLKTTQSFIRPFNRDGFKVTVYDQMPPYYFFWFDVNRNTTDIARPGPNEKEILQNYRYRMYPKSAAGNYVGELI